MPRYKQIGRVSALRCRRPPASIAFCPRRRRFPLLKPARGVILARNRPESGECRLRRINLSPYGRVVKCERPESAQGPRQLDRSGTPARHPAEPIPTVLRTQVRGISTIPNTTTPRLNCAVSGYVRDHRAGGTRGTDRSADAPRALQRPLDGPTTVLADVVQRMLSTHAAVHNTFTFDAIWSRVRHSGSSEPRRRIKGEMRLPQRDHLFCLMLPSPPQKLI
jgi:hypothetical protein